MNNTAPVSIEKKSHLNIGAGILYILAFMMNLGICLYDIFVYDWNVLDYLRSSYLDVAFELIILTLAISLLARCRNHLLTVLFGLLTVIEAIRLYEVLRDFNYYYNEDYAVLDLLIRIFSVVAFLLATIITAILVSTKGKPQSGISRIWFLPCLLYLTGIVIQIVSNFAYFIDSFSDRSYLKILPYFMWLAEDVFMIIAFFLAMKFLSRSCRVSGSAASPAQYAPQYNPYAQQPQQPYGYAPVQPQQPYGYAPSQPQQPYYNPAPVQQPAYDPAQNQQTYTPPAAQANPAYEPAPKPSPAADPVQPERKIIGYDPMTGVPIYED